MNSRKFVAVFEASPSGELNPAELSTRILAPGKVVMVIDESSKRIYMWLGMGSSQNNRMTAKRAANSIPIFGLRAKGLEFPVGRDCRIIEIDQSLIESTSETSSSFVELQELLKKSYKKVADGVWYTVEKYEMVSEKVKPEAKIVEGRMLYEMSHLEKETTEKDKKRKTEERKK
ncbi:MAG: hypothetical protein WED05_00365 [Candidatus Atabeyarchaeum deiterrae]